MGIASVVLAFYGYKETNVDNTVNYEKTKAKVTSYIVTSQNFNQNAGSVAVGNTQVNINKNVTKYSATINYEYSIGETKYTGHFYDNMNVVPMFDANKDNVENNAKNYVGKDVDVFYLKSNPSASSLTIEKNSSFGMFIGAGIIGVLALIIPFMNFSSFGSSSSSFRIGNNYVSSDSNGNNYVSLTV